MSKRSQYILNCAIGTTAFAGLALAIVKVLHIHAWWQVGLMILAAKICGAGLGAVYTWSQWKGMPTEGEVERALANADKPFVKPDDLVALIEEVRSRNGDGSPYWLPQPRQIRRHLLSLQKRGRVVAKHCHESDSVRGYQPYLTFALSERAA